MSPRPRIYRAGIVALLAAYACFAWPGLYHLAAHVLDVSEAWTLPNGWTIQRAWLYPAAVDGGIFVAGVILLTEDRLAEHDRLRLEVWAGMWVVAALSGLGLLTDQWSKDGVSRWASLLVLAPVVIATWFLHMVVRVQAEAAGDAAGKADVREEESAGGSDVHDPDSDSSAPDDDDPADDLDEEFEALIEAIRSNGHGGTKTEKAIALIGAYDSTGRTRPSISQLAKLTGCSTGIAQIALTRTRGE